MTLELIILADLAQVTGRSQAWWRRHWLRMHERHGFPRRLPDLWAWPRPAVEAWSRGGGLVATAAPANENRPDAILDRDEVRLRRRFGIA